jgi:predicted chitinase
MKEMPRTITALASLFLIFSIGACSTSTNQANNQTENQSTNQAKNQTGFMITEAQFESIFPKRILFYTYAGLLEATKAYPEFGNFGSEAENKREVAAFLANIMHESNELQAINEFDTSVYDHYCNDKNGVACAKGQQYFGRGPIQLSWNFNYALAGKALGVDLLNDPGLVARDSTIAWKTALWYWMEIKGPAPLPSHVAMKQSLGFGETVRSINGNLECAKPNDSRGYKQQQMRIKNYLKISAILSVDPGKYSAC